MARNRSERRPERRPARPDAEAAPAPAPSAEAPALRLLRGGLSLAVPGLGQLAGRRLVAAFLCFVGALVPYVFFLVLLNDRYGVRGELLSFSFSDARGPIRPPAEHWGLLLVGLAVHAAAVWDAARSCVAGRRS